MSEDGHRRARRTCTIALVKYKQLGWTRRTRRGSPEKDLAVATAPCSLVSVVADSSAGAENVPRRLLWRSE